MRADPVTTGSKERARFGYNPGTVVGLSTRATAEARPAARGSADARLALAALTMGLLFGAILVAPMPLWSGRPVGPPAPGAPPTEPVGWPGLVLTAIFVAGLCVPYRAYSGACVAVARSGSKRVLLGLTAGLALVALLIYPAYGSDIFDYVGFERMWVVYADNPLTALPLNHPDDWATRFVWYPDRTPAYGPLWAVLTWPIVRLAGDSPALDVLGYKALALLGYASCCLVIWRSVAPSRRARALVTFAWSPLVLFEVLGKVHNDVLPALAMVVGLGLLAGRTRASRAGSLAALVAGGLVKVTALAAAPVAAVYLLGRDGWRGVLAAGALALALAVVVYAPFWAGAATFAPLLGQTSRLVWSPASLLIVLLNRLPSGPYDGLVRLGLVLVWAVAVGLVLWRTWPAARRTPQNPAQHTAQDAALAAEAPAWLLLATLLLLTSAVFAHYLVPAVALAALADNRHLDRVVMWLSIGGLAAYGVDLLGLAFGSDWLGSDAYRVLGTLILLGPATLALLARRTAPDPAPE
jgi:hypothetical protein